VLRFAAVATLLGTGRRFVGDRSVPLAGRYHAGRADDIRVLRWSFTKGFKVQTPDGFRLEARQDAFFGWEHGVDDSS
jgi:hypothetical protein